jgi:hypothetical protein
MNSISLTAFSSFTIRIARTVTVAAALILGMLPRTSLAAGHGSSSTLAVEGSATNTVTSLDFINANTIAIEAEQVGELTNFGKFTGEFSYVAVVHPESTVIFGTATLTNENGDQLFLTVRVVELGAEYPFTVLGTLTVTGGTGNYAGARGTIALTGEDDVSLSDTFQLSGVLAIGN